MDRWDQERPTMEGRGLTEERILAILKEAVAGVAAINLCRSHGVAERVTTERRSQLSPHQVPFF